MPTLQFWKTQPVPQLPAASTSSTIEEGPIDTVKTIADVKQEPPALPSGFDWSQIDIKNEEQVSLNVSAILRGADYLGIEELSIP